MRRDEGKEVRGNKNATLVQELGTKPDRELPVFIYCFHESG